MKESANLSYKGESEMQHTTDNPAIAFCNKCGSKLEQGSNSCPNSECICAPNDHVPFNARNPDKEPSTIGLSLCGLLSLGAGVALFFYGHYIRAQTSTWSFNASLSLVNRYGWNGGGHYIQIGIGLCVLAVVFFILGFWKRNKSRR